jgi:hypothetical protein
VCDQGGGSIRLEGCVEVCVRDRDWVQVRKEHEIHIWINITGRDAWTYSCDAILISIHDIDYILLKSMALLGMLYGPLC